MKKLFIILSLCAATSFAQYSQFNGTTTQMTAAAGAAAGTRWWNTTNVELYISNGTTWLPQGSAIVSWHSATARQSVGWNFDTTKSAHVDTLPALSSVYVGDEVFIYDYLGNGATDSIRTIPLSPDSMITVPMQQQSTNAWVAGVAATGAINAAEIYSAYRYVEFEAIPSNNGNTSGLRWLRIY